MATRRDHGRADPIALSARFSKGHPTVYQGKGGIPRSVPAWQYLTRHGFEQLTTYQPASHFWPFQWIEGAWLLVLSATLLTVTVWLVRRRTS